MTQVFAVRVLHHDRTSLRLRVFDRVAGGEVAHGGETWALPSTAPATRTVELRRLGGRWLVSGVSR